MRYLKKVLSKAKKAPDKSAKRALTFSVIETEVVSRDNQAKLVLMITIDEDKVIKDAKASALSDTDESGAPMKYEDVYRDIMKEALAEMKAVKIREVMVNRDGSGIEMPRDYLYLSFQLMQDNKPIDFDDVKYEYAGSEVIRIEDAIYRTL